MKHPVQACTSLKIKGLQAYFLKENAGIGSDHWFPMTLPSILICFAASEQKLWNSGRNLRNYWFCLSLTQVTSVSSHAAHWGGREGKGTSVVSKPSLSPLTTVQVLNRAVLSCSVVLRIVFHVSVLALNSLSQISLMPAPCEICIYRAATVPSLEGLRMWELLGHRLFVQSSTELVLLDDFFICLHCILKLP